MSLDTPKGFLDPDDMPNMSPYRAAQRRAKIIKLTAQGKTGSEIAELMGISRQRVSQLRDAENVERLPKPHVARREQIPALIEQRLSGIDMARFFGCSCWAIYADLRAMNLSAAQREKLKENRSLAMSNAKIQAHEKRLKARRRSKKTKT